MEEVLVQAAVAQRCMSLFYKVNGAWPELVMGNTEKEAMFVLASFLTEHLGFFDTFLYIHSCTCIYNI